MSLKQSQKGKILGIYPRKLLFFGIILVAGIIYFQYLNYSKFQADTALDSSIATSIVEQKINIEIKKNGEFFVDGKKEGSLESVDNVDELRLIVIDKPKSYIDSFSALVKLPSAVASETKVEILAIHGVDSAIAKAITKDTIEYRAYGISSLATITLVAKLPKGVIAKPFLERVFNSVANIEFNFWLLLAVALPVITVIYMILFTAFQIRLNRVDQPDQPTNTPPMAIPPALVGVLFHEKVGAREVAATLIDLAKRRDIVILDRDRGFAFGKGRFDQRLLPFEKILLSKIFKNNLTSEQKYIEERIASHLYSKKMSIVSAGIYSLATRLGYFRYNPRKIHAKYRLFGILAFLGGAAGFILSYMIDFLPAFTVFFWVGMMVSALIIAFTAGRIPERTPLGNEALSNWLAFRKFLTDPEPIPYNSTVYALFEQYLPYAVVLDCEAAWAKRFEKHNFILPEWFLTDKEGLGIEEFCLALFPIVSYVGRSFASIREPGFE